jgi:hypothetical protein
MRGVKLAMVESIPNPSMPQALRLEHVPAGYGLLGFNT